MRKLLILLSVFLISVSSFAIGTPTIGGLAYVVDTVDHYKVGPGTIYTRLHFIHPKSPLWVYIYEVELGNPYVKVKAETSTGLMKGMEQISSIAKRKSSQGNLYFAGINGDFYNTVTGEPVNGFATERALGKAPLSYRSCFTITDTKVPFIDVFAFNGSIKFNNSSFAISNANTDRGADQLILYNSLQGSATSTNQYGTELLLELQEGDWLINSGVKKAKVVNKENGVGSMAITPNHVVLSGNGTAKTFLDAINVGDEVELTTDILLSDQSNAGTISEMIGGSEHRMLKDGEIVGVNWAELHPRTGIGYNSDKSKAYFIVVDGRSSLSVGVTTHVLGEILRMVGASDGLNLDGGGSSGMYLEKYGIVNRGSDGKERSVSNGIFAVSTAPVETEIASLSFTKSYYEVPIYSTMKPTIVGYDKYGHLIATDIPATFSCSSTLGSIDNSKGFIAGGSALVDNLTATYNNVSVNVPVSVVNDGIVSILKDSIILDTKRDYEIDVECFLNENEFPIHPKALAWTVKDPSICSVSEGGVVKGISAGKTLVIGEFKGVKDTLMVNIQPIIDNPYTQTNFEDIENFTFAGSSSTLQNITLNTDNLPIGWDDGGRLNFKYTKGRYSELKLVYSPKLYSIPDSIQLTLNTGNATISGVNLLMIANNESSTKTISLGAVEPNKDVSLGYNLKNIYPEDNILYYPLNLMSIGLSIQDAKHTADTSYDIYLKDLKLFYSGYAMGLDELVSPSGEVYIYPNPVKNGEAVLNFKSESAQSFKVDVYTVAGQFCKTREFSSIDSDQYIIPVQDLSKGVYLVAISQNGGVKETIKMIVE